MRWDIPLKYGEKWSHSRRQRSPQSAYARHLNDRKWQNNSAGTHDTPGYRCREMSGFDRSSWWSLRQNPPTNPKIPKQWCRTLWYHWCRLSYRIQYIGKYTPSVPFPHSELDSLSIQKNIWLQLGSSPRVCPQERDPDAPRKRWEYPPRSHAPPLWWRVS